MNYEKSITSSVGDVFGGLSPLSQQRLSEAHTQTLCASCGRRVPVSDRAVVTVNNEVRVFHANCSDSGPIELRALARRRPTALSETKERIRRARQWRG